MALTKVLLVGATGETGGSIANGLLESGNFVRSKPILPCILETQPNMDVTNWSSYRKSSLSHVPLQYQSLNSCNWKSAV